MDYLVIKQTADETLVSRFRRQRKTLVCVGATSCNHLEGESLIECLPEAGGPAGVDNRIILLLAPGELFFRELALQMTDRRKLREILPLELKGETALESDDLLFDAMVLDGGKVLAVWGCRSGVVKAIEELSGESLEPEFVTCSHFAWQHILPNEADDGTFTAISDGDSLAVYKGGVPVFFRVLAGEDRAAEVTRTVAALEIGRGITVNRLYLHGSLADDGLSRLPSAELLPVSGALADAFSGDDVTARKLAGAFAVATACCFGDPVNFRSGDLIYTRGRDKLRKNLRLTVALVLIFVTLIFSQLGIRYYFIKKDLASLNSSISSIYRELFPNRKKAVDEAGELRSEIKRLGNGASSGGTLLIMKKLADIKTDDITGIFETDIDGDQVRLKGDARSIQAVNDFKTKAAQYFSGAEVSEIKSRPDGTVSFQFKGTGKGEGK